MQEWKKDLSGLFSLAVCAAFFPGKTQNKDWENTICRPVA